MILQSLIPILSHQSNGVILIDTILYKGNFYTRIIDYRTESKTETLYSIDDNIDQIIEQSPKYIIRAIESSRRTICAYVDLLDESKLTKDHYAIYEYIKSKHSRVRLNHVEKEFPDIEIDLIAQILEDLENCYYVSRTAYHYYSLNTKFDHLRSLFEQTKYAR